MKQEIRNMGIKITAFHENQGRDASHVKEWM